MQHLFNSMLSPFAAAPKDDHCHPKRRSTRRQQSQPVEQIITASSHPLHSHGNDLLQQSATLISSYSQADETIAAVEVPENPKRKFVKDSESMIEMLGWGKRAAEREIDRLKGREVEQGSEIGEKVWKKVMEELDDGEGREEAGSKERQKRQRMMVEGPGIEILLRQIDKGCQENGEGCA